MLRAEVLTAQTRLGKDVQMWPCRPWPPLSDLGDSSLTKKNRGIPGTSVFCGPNKRFLVLTHSGTTRGHTPLNTYFKMHGDFIEVDVSTSFNYPLELPTQRLFLKLSSLSSNDASRLLLPHQTRHVLAYP